MNKLSEFGRDTGLQIRMATVMFLLGLVYVVFVGALFAAGVSALFIVIFAGGLALLQLFASDKMALAAMGAKEVTPQEAPELHAMIERLCVQADLPKPKIAIANTRMPNAFALGRSPKNATVCATTGIMELLSPAELEGVMAHELTHVANRDVMVMTLAAFFATIASYIVQFGFYFGGGMGGGDDEDGLGFIAVFLISLAIYAVSFFLMQALSRYREFAADRGAAVITGRPSALASALMKISSGMHQIPQKDLRATEQLAAFYIFPPGVGKGLGSLFATHPPMEKRIEALSAAREPAPDRPLGEPRRRRAARRRAGPAARARSRPPQQRQRRARRVRLPAERAHRHRHLQQARHPVRLDPSLAGEPEDGLDRLLEVPGGADLEDEVQLLVALVEPGVRDPRGQRALLARAELEALAAQRAGEAAREHLERLVGDAVDVLDAHAAAGPRPPSRRGRSARPSPLTSSATGCARR